MDPYIDECMYHILLWLTIFNLLSNDTIITYDNYNTIEIHEAIINNYFATHVQTLHI